MSVILKQNVFNIKNEDGTYMSLNVAAEESTEEKLAQIEAKGQETIASIPSDYTELSNDVADLKEDLSEYFGRIPVLLSADTMFINLSGSTADINNPTVSTTGYHYAVVPCIAGDKFLINASGGAGARAWGFLNTQSQIISVANENAIVNTEITAPTNAVYLVVNDNSGQISYVLGGESIPERVSDLETKTDEMQEEIDSFEGISDDVKEALLACFEHVAWTDEHGQSYYDNLYEALYGVAPQPIVIPINNYAVGVPAWNHVTSEFYYTDDSSGVFMGANISALNIEAGDVVGIDDYVTYQFQIGTNNVNFSPYSTGWIQNDEGGNAQISDYTIKQKDVGYTKVMMVRRKDRAVLTQSDLNYINSHAHVRKA